MKLSKSKLALAKVINENGGWVESSGGEFAAQCSGGEVSFWCGKPSKGIDEWIGDGFTGFQYDIKTTKKIPNWHQTILTREEYYHAYPKADADGWIEWNADGKSDGPIGHDVHVDVKLRCGSEHLGQFLSSDSWMDLWGDASIVAYRLHKPEVKPEFCESVMRSIPEPGVKPTIEQLAQDYRNKLDYANRKQQEADDAKAAADAALGELERAGEALNLVISVAKQSDWLDINDWRDLKIGDWIYIGESPIKSNCPAGEYVICAVDENDEGQPIKVYWNGDGAWPEIKVRGWKFIRRP